VIADDLPRAGLGGWLRGGYGLRVGSVRRIAAGTATDNFRVDHDGGTVMVKVYRTDAAGLLGHERRVLAVTDAAARAGLPVPHLHASTTGALLHEAEGLAASVWQWCDSDNPQGPLTAEVAYQTGAVLARLHTFLRGHDDGSWPVAQPHYRRHTLNQIRQRFTMLARHLGALPEPASADTLNLDRITQRLAQLRQVPSLLESSPPPQYALVHGDFVRPNLLFHHGRLRAFIDMRLKYDEPVRELGRLAFDVATIAAGGGWLQVAEAALTGYLAEGGIIAQAAVHGCARLHSLCSTYPVEELYLGVVPEHLRADLQLYWADRVGAVTEMLEHFDAVEAMVARLTRLPRPARCVG
jgi:Ser/Thr protein kinase RdoA (MazF antagonist)